MSESMTYLLVCKLCGEDQVIPFESAEARGGWAAAHTEGTGHEQWWVKDVPNDNPDNWTPKQVSDHVRGMFERPSTHRVDIVQNDGEVGSIHMDGRDVGQCATSAVVFLQPGRGPKVVLELAPEALGIRSDCADVEMGTETYGLLRELGWVPPMAPKVPVAQAGTDVQDSSGQPASANPA